MHMLDTNVVIHARDSNGAVLHKLANLDGPVAVSALSLAELQRGLIKKNTDTARREARLSFLLQRIEVLPFDRGAAETYGRIVATLGWVRGRDFDRMIAAHAISTRSTLVTANIVDFRDIPGLQIEDWTLAP
jgi:tRNA(fMet)-specific endonuclease VapC